MPSSPGNSARATARPHPLFTEHTAVFFLSTSPPPSAPLAQFDWCLPRGGDGHHSAGAGATTATMPGRTLHQGAGMEKEVAVDQQQAGWSQVRCTVHADDASVVLHAPLIHYLIALSVNRRVFTLGSCFLVAVKCGWGCLIFYIPLSVYSLSKQ